MLKMCYFLLANKSHQEKFLINYDHCLKKSNILVPAIIVTGIFKDFSKILSVKVAN